MRLGKEQSAGVACDEDDQAVLDPHACAIGHGDGPTRAAVAPTASGAARGSGGDGAMALEAH